MPETPGAEGTAPAGTSRAIIERESAERGRLIAQLQAADQARSIVAEALSDAWLTPRVINRLTAALLDGPSLPLVNDRLDEAALRERATSARDQAELEAGEILESAGMGHPRGLGALSPAPGAGSEDKLEDKLEESFRSLGMSESTATLAAKGR